MDPRVTQDDPRRRRILFRATHRGTYENDILIGHYVRRHLALFTEDELDAIEAVMEHPDATLADWLMGRAPVPAEADTAMFRAIRDDAAAGGAVVHGSSVPPLPSGYGGHACANQF